MKKKKIKMYQPVFMEKHEPFVNRKPNLKEKLILLASSIGC